MRTEEKKSSFSIRFIFVYTYMALVRTRNPQTQGDAYVCRLGTLKIDQTEIRNRLRKKSSLWFERSTNANKDQSEEECFRKNVGKKFDWQFFDVAKIYLDYFPCVRYESSNLHSLPLRRRKQRHSSACCKEIHPSVMYEYHVYISLLFSFFLCLSRRGESHCDRRRHFGMNKIEILFCVSSGFRFHEFKCI